MTSSKCITNQADGSPLHLILTDVANVLLRLLYLKIAVCAALHRVSRNGPFHEKAMKLASATVTTPDALNKCDCSVFNATLLLVELAPEVAAKVALHSQRSAATLCHELRLAPRTRAPDVATPDLLR